MVEPRIEHELGEAYGLGMAAIRERVEDPDLDPGVDRKRRDALVAAHGVAIVDQHTHARAAVGGPQQGLAQQLARVVATKDVVLQIEGLLGPVDHLHAGEEAVDAVRQDAKP